MRLPRFRFTIRRSMALVAMVATLMGSGIMVKRLIHLHVVYQERSTDHDQEERYARGLLSQLADIKDAYQGMKGKIDDPPLDPEGEKRWKELMKTDPDVQRVASDVIQQDKLVEEMMRPLEEVMKVARSEIDYHARLKKKYERAAARPWLSVLPDAEDSGVNLLEMTMTALERMESKATEIDRLPLPPRLQIIEAEPPSG
jgi:hypothetical protein